MIRRRFRPLLVLLLLASGCAYQVSRVQGVASPERIRTLRRVAVAPFRYASDWTGLFRAIYEQAGLKAPDGRKIESLEGAFLIRDALAAKGYEPVPWPGDPGSAKAGDASRPGEELTKARLLSLRKAKAQAVIFAGGARRCGGIESCAAWVRVRLVDVGSGAVVWKSEARGATAFSRGDEMKAAVRYALEGLPASLSGSRRERTPAAASCAGSGAP